MFKCETNYFQNFIIELYNSYLKFINDKFSKEEMFNFIFSKCFIFIKKKYFNDRKINENCFKEHFFQQYFEGLVNSNEFELFFEE